jgi:hypothetical protein
MEIMHEIPKYFLAVAMERTITRQDQRCQSREVRSPASLTAENQSGMAKSQAISIASQCGSSMKEREKDKPALSM